MLPPACVNVPQAKLCERNFGDLPENVDLSRHAFQGHSKFIGTETDWSATYDFQTPHDVRTHVFFFFLKKNGLVLDSLSLVTMELSHTVSEISGDFSRK